MKRNYIKCISILMLLFVAFPAFAQKTVTGTVKDASGETIPAVGIRIKGSQKATSSDSNGKFSIAASPNDILIFSYIGYSTKEQLVGSASNIDITLAASASDLNEVEVTTALGVKREKRSLGYAAQTVNGKI